ncbi:ring-infected erythrocyte surface antigen-like [Xenopus laevis]|uniref:Ring-infected erythrocyte surface antigen-like n=1 Tax=Xenopus laevis TaxID=8355 RepID=A0A8J1KWB4_XENLA|nr:ring-infected erythrocyte surface antigen-like [Xenopus laevis]
MYTEMPCLGITRAECGNCHRQLPTEEIIAHDICQEIDIGHNSCQEEPDENNGHDICQEEPEDNISHHSYQEQPEEPGTEISQGNASEEEENIEEQDEEENNSFDMLISSGEEESISDDLFPFLEKQPEKMIAHDNCQEEPETNIGHFQEQPEEPGTEISQGNASEEEENLGEQEEEERNSDDMVISSGEEESFIDDLFPSLEKQLEEMIAHEICQEEPETNIGHFQEQPEEPGKEFSQGNASEEEDNLEEQDEEENNSDDMVICSDEEESIIDDLFPSLEV